MKKLKILASLMMLVAVTLSCKKTDESASSFNDGGQAVDEKKALTLSTYTPCGYYADPRDTSMVPFFFDDYAQCVSQRPKWWPNLLFEIPSNEVEVSPFYSYSLARTLDDAIAENIIMTYLHSGDESAPGLGAGRPISADEQHFWIDISKKK